jgi:hypothetical protein
VGPSRTGLIALVAALATAAPGCGSDDDQQAGDPPTYEPRVVRIDELDLQLRVPAELADLSYTVGEFERIHPTLNFSTQRLAEAGGPACEAGAEGAVSPYPIGQVIVSTESPREVAEEAEDNPEENLGTFVRAVGDRYVYYIAPPPEDCTSDDEDAAGMQHELTVALREALPTFRPLRP